MICKIWRGLLSGLTFYVKQFYMVFVFSCFDDGFYPMWWSFILQYISRPYSSRNGEKVIYDSSRKVNLLLVHRRMRFYQANFEQNFLFGPSHLYQLSPYCEI